MYKTQFNLQVIAQIHCPSSQLIKNGGRVLWAHCQTISRSVCHWIIYLKCKLNSLANHRCKILARIT